MDSSALVAMLLHEPDAERFTAAILTSKTRRMPAPNWLETAMVFEGRTTAESYVKLDQLIERPAIDVVAFGADEAVAARQANRRSGRSHDAKLNHGDCMAYALAKTTGEPLLFEGNDFIHTDITPALA